MTGGVEENERGVRRGGEGSSAWFGRNTPWPGPEHPWARGRGKNYVERSQRFCID